MAEYKLRRAIESDCDDVLSWRNQDVVRRSMIAQDPISPDQHRAWWEKATTDETRRVLILECEGVPVSVVTFFTIDRVARSGWWGFYLTDRVGAAPVSALVLWQDVERAALRYAFEQLRLEVLLCETRDTNEPVLFLHDRFGFETLPSEGFPNAIEHGLVVKRYTAAIFERKREAGLFETELRLAIDPDTAISARLTTGKTKRPLTAAFLASANWTLLADTFNSEYQAWTGEAAEAFAPEFGKYRMELRDPESSLRKAKPDYLVFAERIEDFIPAQAVLGEEFDAVIKERFAGYVEDIRAARAEMPGAIIIHDFASVRTRPLTFVEQSKRSSVVDRRIQAMNEELHELAAEIGNAVILPISEVIASVGRRNADPGKYWLMGRFPFAPAIDEAYCSALAGLILARSGRTARALVLDLDNTMWGGVIGDDGLDGIGLGPDYPDNQFVAFQSVLKALKARGLLLTIASKNTESVAREAINSHPGMVLSEADFIGSAINWEAKSRNILDLSRALDLGASSFMLIDDNPVERDEVRLNAAGVIVPEMPEDVAEWPAFLLGHPALAAVDLTDEDIGRARTYEIRKTIASAERSAVSREEFLKSLGMSMEVRPVTAGSRQRAFQLISKTNQFNTTAKRYSEMELRAFEQDGELLTMRIRDRYGSDEVVGVIAVAYDRDSRTAIIDNYVMSCRVLGRGVEAGALAIVSERARERNCIVLTGDIVETERNHPCRNVYADAGFGETLGPAKGVRRYYYDISAAPLARPSWIEISEIEKAA